MKNIRFFPEQLVWSRTLMMRAAFICGGRMVLPLP